MPTTRASRYSSPNSPSRTSRPRRQVGRGAPAALGPAFIAAIAYVDPGNFATNFESGSTFGYQLLWVVVAANLMAMLIQAQTAKLGPATGRDLATLCRERLPRPLTWGLWLQAEGVAIATDLAEIVGGAVALHLLFGVPLPVGGCITAAVAFGLLAAQTKGFRPFETVITGLLLVIAGGFFYDLLLAGVDPAAAAAGLAPSFSGSESVLLASGILGATVMPHAIYVHSALTPTRYWALGLEDENGMSSQTVRRRIWRMQRLDVVLAMGLAGLVNAAMLIVAAQFFDGGEPPHGLEGVYEGLQATAGGSAALAFGLALLASGLAASAVGTYAGQVVMAGFLRRQIPLLLRRVLTVTPALVVLFVGFDPTQALIWSQVVLSFGIPFALAPLVWLTSSRSVMGDWVSHGATTAALAVVAALIVSLNGYLLVLMALG